MKTQFYVLLISIILGVTLADKCKDLSVVPHDCSFYTECLEDKYHCGNDGYPVGYGNKYCSKFLEFFDSFDTKGQEWVEKTLLCLKESLIDHVEDEEGLTCKNIYDLAFDSHPDCYVNSGFCDIMLHDTFNTVKALLKVYEVKDFAQLAALKQIRDTTRKCGKKVMFNFMSSLKEVFSSDFLSAPVTDADLEPFIFFDGNM